MSDRFFRRLAGWSLAVVGGLSFAGVVFGDGRLALGLTAGGLWNMANLFCLGRLLTAWLGPQPSTRRVVGWLFVKFLGLYALAVWLLREPAIHPVGFGAGFTVVLGTAGVLILRRVRRLMTPLVHDR